MEEQPQKDCVASESTDLAHYIAKATATRTPLTVSFELTHRCNFRCVHCYLGDQEEIHKHRHRELDTDTVIGLLDDMVKTGTLFLVLTGGDPMLRPDFVKIYEHAVRIGLLVTVFCNGSLLTDDIISAFVRYPPRVVEMTVYGATPKTFDAVTQKSGSFVACMEGIARLQAAKVCLRLKAMIITLNVDEFQAIRALAEDIGVQFRHDCSLHAVMPNDDNAGCANCGSDLTDPLRFRISPEQAAEVDMENGELALKLIESVETLGSKKQLAELYRCGAGRMSYHVNPYGRLQPCLITHSHSVILGKEGVLAGWKALLKEFPSRAGVASFPCHNCNNRDICTGCPSAFALVTGRPEQVDTFYCQYAECRRKKIEKFSKNGC
jgi:radical SAM protein with 4Fe4S-binding SPASM domain